jgi:hypothetical protein
MARSKPFFDLYFQTTIMLAAISDVTNQAFDYVIVGGGVCPHRKTPQTLFLMANRPQV